MIPVSPELPKTPIDSCTKEEKELQYSRQTLSYKAKLKETSRKSRNRAYLAFEEFRLLRSANMDKIKLLEVGRKIILIYDIIP